MTNIDDAAGKRRERAIRAADGITLGGRGADEFTAEDHKFFATEGELAILAHLSHIRELPSLWTEKVEINEKDVKSICDSLMKKGLLVTGEDGKLRVRRSVPFLLGIASTAEKRLECRTYTRGAIEGLLYIYARGEDLLIAEYHAGEGYQFIWVPAMPLAVGGLLSYLRAMDDDIAPKSDIPNAPCALGGTPQRDFARANDEYFGAGKTDTIVMSFHGTGESAQSVGFIRIGNRLFSKSQFSGNDWKPLKKLEASLPASKWLVAAHREELVKAKGEST